jgi:hypothetical protein
MRAARIGCPIRRTPCATFADIQREDDPRPQGPGEFCRWVLYTVVGVSKTPPKLPMANEAVPDGGGK